MAACPLQYRVLIYMNVRESKFELSGNNELLLFWHDIEIEAHKSKQQQQQRSEKPSKYRKLY